MKRADVKQLSRPQKRKLKLPTPHDSFTKSVLSELPHARAFLQGYLPPLLVEAFNWDTLRLESGTLTEPAQEEAVRQSLESVAEEFQPVKETAMSLLEHLEKRGERRGEKRGERRGQKLAEERGEQRGRLLERTELLARMLKIAYPDFTETDALLVAKLPVKSLAELTDAVALHRPWKEIRKLLQA